MGAGRDSQPPALEGGSRLPFALSADSWAPPERAGDHSSLSLPSDPTLTCPLGLPGQPRPLLLPNSPCTLFTPSSDLPPPSPRPAAFPPTRFVCCLRAPCSPPSPNTRIFLSPSMPLPFRKAGLPSCPLPAASSPASHPS